MKKTCIKLRLKNIDVSTCTRLQNACTIWKGAMMRIMQLTAKRKVNAFDVRIDLVEGIPSLDVWDNRAGELLTFQIRQVVDLKYILRGMIRSRHA